MSRPTKEMHQLIDMYLDSGGEWPVRSKDIASWLLKNNLWKITEDSVLKACAQNVSKAMREDHATDSKGRSVRQKHPVKKKNAAGKQETFWDDINTASHSHMQLAFQQRRRLIVADCAQLKTDVDSYNDQDRNTDRPIQMIFDFTDDLADLDELDEAA